MKRICVIGSLNVDLTLELDRFHGPGETVLAKSLRVYPGGKGGNQAVAAAKLEIPVQMVGLLGDDENGNYYRRVLRKNGVNDQYVGTIKDVPSGNALIEVDSHGENRIAVVGGTNMLVSKEYVGSILKQLLENDIFLMQFEIPLDTVEYAAEVLRQHGKIVILDPAPAMAVSDKLLSCVDYVIPNKSELALLTGMEVETDEQVVAAAQSLLRRGVQAVIAKLGGRGCMYVDWERVQVVDGFRVNTVDTTAAGDSFNAGFAAAIAYGKPLQEALRFANAVGALSTTAQGAQSAMPVLEETNRFLEKVRVGSQCEF